jgi:hypothetical protein
MYSACGKGMSMEVGKPKCWMMQQLVSHLSNIHSLLVAYSCFIQDSNVPAKKHFPASHASMVM